MIKSLINFFQPTKAHRFNLDYASEAEAMYQRIAKDFGLEVVKRPDDPVELSMIFPKQPGLKTDVWVCLQNLDEVWFTIEGHTCSMFPFEEVKDEFEEKLRAALSGELRVRKFVRRRDGKLFKSFLQQRVGGRWVSVSGHGSLISLLPTLNYDIVDVMLSPDETANLRVQK